MNTRHCVWHTCKFTCSWVLMQEVGDSGSLKLTATNGNVRLRLALSNDGAGRYITQHCPMHEFSGRMVFLQSYLYNLFDTELTGVACKSAAKHSVQACGHPRQGFCICMQHGSLRLYFHLLKRDDWWCCHSGGT